MLLFLRRLDVGSGRLVRGVRVVLDCLPELFVACVERRVGADAAEVFVCDINWFVGRRLTSPRRRR